MVRHSIDQRLYYVSKATYRFLKSLYVLEVRFLFLLVGVLEILNLSGVGILRLLQLSLTGILHLLQLSCVGIFHAIQFKKMSLSQVSCGGSYGLKGRFETLHGRFRQGF
jgi:hypothetical protein